MAEKQIEIASYAEKRLDIKSGDLLAFSHGDWKTWSGIKTEIVRIFTRSTYSHVGIAWVVECKHSRRVFVLEAVKPYLRIFPLSQSGDFYHLEMPVEWNPEAEEFAISNIGMEYSERKAMEAFFRKLPNGDVTECAAFVREVYKLMNIDLGEMSRPDTVIHAAQSKYKAPMIYVEKF
jgi:hypothetical protein